MQPITDTQRRVYDALIAFEAAHSRAPTQQELAIALGQKSRSNIHRHLATLERAGWIKREYHHVMTVRSLMQDKAA